MAEGHTIHALAERFNVAFAQTTPRITSPQGAIAIAQPINGHRVDAAEAWGKHLLVRFDDAPTLHCHLGMFGRFSVRLHRRAVRDGWLRSEPPVQSSERLRLLTLTHHGALRAPTVCELLDDAGVDALVARLGPDPLRPDHDRERVMTALGASRREIGQLLLDQSVVAGIGNVYRSELLHRARLSPFTPGRSIAPAQLRELWQDTIDLMTTGAAAGWIVTDDQQLANARTLIDSGSRVPRWPKRYAVYQRTGHPCRTCATTIFSEPQGRQRVFWCPRCQVV